MILLYLKIDMLCRHSFVDISPYRVGQLNIFMKDEEILNLTPTLVI